MRRLAGSLLFLAACGGSDAAAGDPCHPDPASFVLEADVQLPFSLLLRDVEVAWADGRGDVARPADPETINVLLRRSFVDAAAARAFRGGVTVFVDGYIVGSAPLAARDCVDDAAIVGVDPDELHLTHGSFVVLEDGPGADDGFAYTVSPLAAPLCARSPRTIGLGRDTCVSDRRFIALTLPADRPVDAYVGDTFHPADAFIVDQGAILYRYEIEFPPDAPIDTLGAEMTFGRDGVLVGEVTLDFSSCLRFGFGPDPALLRVQEQGLAIGPTGAIAIDNGRGISCAYVDGSYFTGSPLD